MSMSSIQEKPAVLLDSRAFRQALGHFPTGVAVVTTRGSDGRPVGLTINSFSSLSLDPPLILWSLVNHSPSLDIFLNCDHFAINIMSEAQAELALNFANPKVEDKFAMAAHQDCEEGIPLIDGCSARFVCENYQSHEGGDHRLFIGRVLRHEADGHAPAVFHQGRFARLAMA